MNINDVLSVPLMNQEIDRKGNPDPLSDFKKALGQSIEELNRLSDEAEQKVQGMVMGETDIHEAMIAMEKAGISLKLMIQVRNKVIAAYEEIMRMQF
ncbi:MAG: flagellar hook-basal body complex protein FliE [Thermodesulfobacteriota bacterium]|nr:flagellar hook-basal body complex protein FliE [Thermodesulfobacteriota bacterium]